MNETFTCAECGQTFPTAWSDEEATREMNATFPGLQKEEADVVCDECYQKIMKGRA